MNYYDFNDDDNRGGGNLSSSIERTPVVSDLMLIPITKKFNKAPAPGYDVKTMKREASYLEKELKDVIDSITSLQKQNVELKSYTATVFHVNKHNAQVCRLQIQEFQEELKVVHDEILLLQKYDNHGDYHNNNKNNKNNNEIHIDYTKIDEVLERADSMSMMPMISNDVKTLAFTKLRNAIRQTFLLENIDKVLRNFYHQRVLSITLSGWKTYLDTKALGLKLKQQIHKKINQQTLQQWKILTLNRSISENNVKKRSFKIWMKITRWRLWSTCKAQNFRNKRHASQFFKAWKSQCTFLDWGNLVIAAHYQHAGSYFLRRMFYALKNSVKDNKDDECNKVSLISNKLKSKFYGIWLSSCEKKWQRRGQLIRTFFTNITSLVLDKHRVIHSKREAIRFWSGISKRQVLHKWTHILRHKNKQLSQNQCRKLNKLHLTNMFKCFKQSIGVNSKLRRSYDRAIHKYDFYSKIQSFKMLSLYSLIHRKRRWKCDKFLLKKFANRWKKFMACKGDLKKMNTKVTSHRKKRNFNTMALIFNTLYRLKENRNRYNRYQKIITWKTNKQLMSSCFKYMSSTWSSRLYKTVIVKSKTVASTESVDNIRDRKKILLLETERKRVQIHEYEGKIMELQKILSENRSALENTVTSIHQEESLMDNLSQEYKETLQKISSAIQEHNKYKNVDHLMGVRKMYEDLRRVALEQSSQSSQLDDSSVEEKSMNSYDATDSLGFDNDTSDEAAILKNSDYNTLSVRNTNSIINTTNTYDIARTSVNRIANKFKKRLTLE